MLDVKKPPVCLKQLENDPNERSLVYQVVQKSEFLPTVGLPLAPTSDHSLKPGSLNQKVVY